MALENLGIGAYDVPERGYGGRQIQNIVRVQQAGPLGRRAFMNSRVAFSQLDLDIHSNTEAPTIRVLDSFTSGGAQQHQDLRYDWLQIMADVDYVRGVHSFRVGNDLWFQHVRNIQGTITSALTRSAASTTSTRAAPRSQSGSSAIRRSRSSAFAGGVPSRTTSS